MPRWLQWALLLAFAGTATYCGHAHSVREIPGHRAQLDLLFPPAVFNLSCGWNQKNQGVARCDVLDHEARAMPRDWRALGWRELPSPSNAPTVWCSDAFVLSLHEGRGNIQFVAVLTRVDKQPEITLSTDQKRCRALGRPSR